MSIFKPFKDAIKGIPVVGTAVRRVYRGFRPVSPVPFRNSAGYWERRYSGGGNSGVGSYEKFARFKAEIVNQFVDEHDVETLIEFGCGDGNQLSLARYSKYTGYDISATAVSLCRKRFATDPTKTFRPMNEYTGETADLILSLDVIFHLVEDEVYEQYMKTLFDASRRYVIVYSSDTDDNEGYTGTYVRHRKVTRWVESNHPEWALLRRIPNRYPYHGDYTQGSFADFFIYEKREAR